MLRTALRRPGRRGRPTRSRPAPTRPPARPRLELLEARDVPSAPYSPLGTPQIVASLPQQPVDHSQSLTFAIANNARGDSITASVNLPEPHDMVLNGDGLWYTFMDRFGNAAGPVLVEGLDYNPYDSLHTWDLTGAVAVAVAPGPPYGPAAPYSPFAIAYVQDDAYYTDPSQPPVRTTETLYVRQFDWYGNQVGNLASGMFALYGTWAVFALKAPSLSPLRTNTPLAQHCRRRGFAWQEALRRCCAESRTGQRRGHRGTAGGKPSKPPGTLLAALGQRH